LPPWPFIATHEAGTGTGPPRLAFRRGPFPPQGIYLFTGGFAEVHGRKVRYAVPWDRVREVRHKSVEHWLNFIPFAYVAKCFITLDNGGEIELDGTYRPLERLARDLQAR